MVDSLHFFQFNDNFAEFHGVGRLHQHGGAGGEFPAQGRKDLLNGGEMLCPGTGGLGDGGGLGRPLLLNLNLLFDKQLSTTGLMICESNDLPRQRYSLRTAMRVMLDSDSYRRELLDHAVAFEHRYPYYIKGGFAAVVGVQVLLFVLSTVLDIDNNGKIILLVIWIISVIAICGWLINIEYIRASLNTQMRISALSDEDLRREMREHTAAIPAARAHPPHTPRPPPTGSHSPDSTVG